MTDLTDRDRRLLMDTLEKLDYAEAMIRDALLTVPEDTVACWDLKNALHSVQGASTAIVIVVKDAVKRADSARKPE